MAFDIDVIKRVYSEMSSKIERAKQVIGKPLTLSEKVLYSHLWNEEISSPYIRGGDYVDFVGLAIWKTIKWGFILIILLLIIFLN